MSSGCLSSAAATDSSISSAMAAMTDSLVGKYRLNVLGDTSAAAAICSTVVLS